MTTRPRISVGLPVYNGAEYLAQTMEALLGQTLADFELIVCDNASTDATAAVAQTFVARDSRVRYVRNEVNIGLAGNYRRALALAQGDYFRWHAADDLVAPTALAECAAVLDREAGVVLAYPRTQLIDARGVVLGDYDDNLHLPHDRPSDRFRALFEKMRLCNTIFGLTRTAVLRRVRPLGAFVASDIVHQAELSLYGKFWEVPQRLFLRRFHPAASSALTPAQLLDFFNPGVRDETFRREWRHLWELLRGALHAPISVAEKGRVIAQLMRRARLNREGLARELWAPLGRRSSPGRRRT